MENEERMCDVCGAKHGHYRWVRLLLAVLIGVFIFLAGIQLGEMRAQVYGYSGHNRMMMRRDMNGGDMMWSDQSGQNGTTIMMVHPTPGQPTTTTVAAPATPTPAPAAK